eukprot:2563811-Rhodomonas_salina.2
MRGLVWLLLRGSVRCGWQRTPKSSTAAETGLRRRRCFALQFDFTYLRLSADETKELAAGTDALEGQRAVLDL